MNEMIQEIAQRIRELRSVLDLSEETMAGYANVPVEEYREYEAGKRDFSFTFLYLIAKHTRTDLTELLTGEAPKLSTLCVIRKGEGLPLERRSGFKYQNLAYLIKDKQSEPFLVEAPYEPDADTKPLVLNYHEGQEFDYVLEGSLRCRVDSEEFVLNAGDAAFYDSNHGHGMLATGGKPCKFLAIIMEKKK